VIFPNPVSTIFSLDSQLEIQNIPIYNPIGQIVKNYKGRIGEFDISELPSGIFYIEITLKNYKNCLKCN
jgi:hypothetical protein